MESHLCGLASHKQGHLGIDRTNNIQASLGHDPRRKRVAQRPCGRRATRGHESFKRQNRCEPAIVRCVGGARGPPAGPAARAPTAGAVSAVLGVELAAKPRLLVALRRPRAARGAA